MAGGGRQADFEGMCGTTLRNVSSDLFLFQENPGSWLRTNPHAPRACKCHKNGIHGYIYVDDLTSTTCISSKIQSRLFCCSLIRLLRSFLDVALPSVKPNLFFLCPYWVSSTNLCSSSLILFFIYCSDAFLLLKEGTSPLPSFSVRVALCMFWPSAMVPESLAEYCEDIFGIFLLLLGPQNQHISVRTCSVCTSLHILFHRRIFMKLTDVVFFPEAHNEVNRGDKWRVLACACLPLRLELSVAARCEANFISFLFWVWVAHEILDWLLLFIGVVSSRVTATVEGRGMEPGKDEFRATVTTRIGAGTEAGVISSSISRKQRKQNYP